VSRLEQPRGDDWVAREVQRRAARAGQPAAAEVPTFSECVIGYRCWAVDPFLRLWPLAGYAETAWTPGINVAQCGRAKLAEAAGFWMPSFPSHAPDGHTSPHQKCGCGLYCRRRAGEVLNELEWPRYEEIRNPLVAGAVAVWGDLCVHKDGFRASHACILALATQPEMPRQARDLAALVADRYGVPLVAADELEVEASRHGTPLPDDIAPPEQPELDIGALYGFGPGVSFGPTPTMPPPPPSSPARPAVRRGRPGSVRGKAGPSRTAVAITALAVVVLAALWSQAVFAVLDHRWWAFVPSLAGGFGLGRAGAKVLFAWERNRTAAS
jgi:hypothetical protein